MFAIVDNERKMMPGCALKVFSLSGDSNTILSIYIYIATRIIILTRPNIPRTVIQLNPTCPLPKSPTISAHGASSVSFFLCLSALTFVYDTRMQDGVCRCSVRRKAMYMLVMRIYFQMLSNLNAGSTPSALDASPSR